MAEPAEAVDLKTARLVAGTPGASLAEPREGMRTAEEKIDSIDEATEATGNVDSAKSIYELAAGNKSEVAAAIQQIAYVLERHLNIDFIREAPLAEVTGGIAHQRAAMGPGREAPHMVGDQVIPPGVNNPTDDLLPPNIPVGQPIPGRDEKPGVGDSGAVADGSDAGQNPVLTSPVPEATPELAAADTTGEPPAQSATRAEWDAYARSKGLNPDDYANKADLQKAAAQA